jgi:hypothetical protein
MKGKPGGLVAIAETIVNFKALLQNALEPA